MHRKTILFIFLIFPSLLIQAQNRKLQFSDPEINKKNEIILSVNNPSTSGVSYKTLLRGNADSLHVEALTLYPERSFYFPLRKELMIYNQFGCFSYDEEIGNWKENSFISSFSDGNPLSPLSLKPLEMSPDGRYGVFIQEDEEGASLILYDREMDVSLSITSKLRHEYIEKLVKWSPDSKYFIYRRGRDLYYFSIDQYQAGRIPAESFRSIGFSDIQSVHWNPGNYLFILKDRLLFRVHSSEFFTRSFYSDPFRKGVVWSRIPIAYDPAFDSYSLDRDGTRLFLLKNGSDGMIFPLNDDSSQSRDFQQAPVLYSSVNNRIETVLWLHDGTLLLFLRNRRDNTGQVLAYKDGKDQGFRELASGDIFGLSSDSSGMQFALLRSGSVEIYDAASLTLLKTLIHHRSLALYWGSDSYISPGQDTIRRINTDSGVSENIGLSQISRAGFSLTGDLYGQCEDVWYKYNEALSWLPQKSRVELGPSNLSNNEYRIYLEEKRGGWFGSSLKIRNIEGYKTSDFLPLYSATQARTVSLPHKREAERNPWYFDHGIPTDQNEITLVLNAVDTAEAVPEVLLILEQYKIPATIFINGDFIHANPGETSLIAESGHRVGSLFYTYFDMSDPEYQLDKTFLKKGLARNEDDYFIATGKEMDMLWHTPFYTINAAILDISASMEYVFIGTDIPVYDRLNLRNPVDSSRFDVVDQALQLINRVKPGSIIPLTLGKNQSQDEYLFLVLPMIIEELLRQGYEFVDLQEMMKSSR